MGHDLINTFASYYKTLLIRIENEVCKHTAFYSSQVYIENVMHKHNWKRDNTDNGGTEIANLCKNDPKNKKQNKKDNTSSRLTFADKAIHTDLEVKIKFDCHIL